MSILFAYPTPTYEQVFGRRGEHVTKTRRPEPVKEPPRKIDSLREAIEEILMSVRGA